MKSYYATGIWAIHVVKWNLTFTPQNFYFIIGGAKFISLIYRTGYYKCYEVKLKNHFNKSYSPWLGFIIKSWIQACLVCLCESSK